MTRILVTVDNAMTTAAATVLRRGVRLAAGRDERDSVH
jgi:hypothetical protein